MSCENESLVPLGIKGVLPLTVKNRICFTMSQGSAKDALFLITQYRISLLWVIYTLREKINRQRSGNGVERVMKSSVDKTRLG